MVKRSDRGLVKLWRAWSIELAAEISANFAIDHQGQQRQVRTALTGRI